MSFQLLLVGEREKSNNKIAKNEDTLLDKI